MNARKIASQMDWRVVAVATLFVCLTASIIHGKWHNNLLYVLKPCGPVVGQLLPGTMRQDQPSKALYDQLRANAIITEEARPYVASEFEAAPWLLPSPLFKYSGIHDLDKLAVIRATPIGNYIKTITIMLYSKDSVMMQNTIYSMVKFGGVRNYIVGTWTEGDLQTCALMNLPCADVSSFLPEPLHSTDGSNAHDQLAIKWLRPAVVFHLLNQSYVTYYSDPDVAYTMKPVFESYLGLIERQMIHVALFEGATGMWLPNNGSLAMMGALTNASHIGMSMGEDDWTHMWTRHNQSVFNSWEFVSCNSSSKNYCLRFARNQLNWRKRPFAFVQVLQPGYQMYSEDRCMLSKPNPPLLDMCDWPILFLYAPCTDIDGRKAVYKYQGLWFMDEDRCVWKTRKGVHAKVCPPLQWVDPNAERMMYSCPKYGLGLIHDGRPMTF